MKETFSSLKYRNFRLFFFGQLTSNIGNWLTNVAIILLVLKLTHSGLDVGILAACSYGPILLLAAWAGSIIDRSNKLRLLLITQTLEMLQSFSLALLAFMPHPPLYGIFVLAIFGGIFLAFDSPNRRSFISEMVPRDNIPNAVTLNGIIVNGARLVGPALAGLLISTVGYGWSFTADGLSYLVIIVSLLKIRPSELFVTKLSTKTRGTVGQAISYIRSTPEIWLTFIILAIIGIFSYNFTVTLPLFVYKSLHGGTESFTILYSIFSLGSIVGALVIAKKRLTGLIHIVAASLLLGLAMLLLSLMPTIALALPAAFLVGLTSLVYMTATTTLVQVKTDASLLARVLALQSVLLFGTTPIGGPLLGELADLKGGRWPLLIGGLAAVAVGIYGRSYLKRTTPFASSNL